MVWCTRSEPIVGNLKRRSAAIIRLGALFAGFVLTGCGTPTPPTTPERPGVLVRDLDMLRLKVNPGDPPGVSPDTAIDAYRRYAKVARSSEARGHALRRLGDLLSQRADRQGSFTERTVDWLNAVGAYRIAYSDLTTHCPEDCADRDDLLYQIARLQGERLGESLASLETLTELVRNHPSSVHVAEAQFRRGEEYYSRRSFERAADAYRAALAAPLSEVLVEDARYRLAWSSYRLGRYQEAAELFAVLLDGSPAAQRSVGLDWQACEGLPEDGRVSNYVRRLSMALYRSGAATSVEVVATQRMLQAYELCVRRALADVFESQGNAAAAARTLSSFLDRKIAADGASPADEPVSARIVDLYRKAGARELLVARQAEHVARFGPVRQAGTDGASMPELWNATPQATRARRYVEDLAQEYGARSRRGDLDAFDQAVAWGSLRLQTGAAEADRVAALADLVQVYRSRSQQPALDVNDRRSALASAIDVQFQLVQAQQASAPDAAAMLFANALDWYFDLEDQTTAAAKGDVRRQAAAQGERFMQQFPQHRERWRVMHNLIRWEVQLERYAPARLWAGRMVAEGTGASKRQKADAWATLATLERNEGNLEAEQNAFAQWIALEDNAERRVQANAGWREATEARALKAERARAWAEAAEHWDSISRRMPDEPPALSAKVRFQYMRSMFCHGNREKTVEVARGLMKSERGSPLAWHAHALLAETLWVSQSWDPVSKELAQLADDLGSEVPPSADLDCGDGRVTVVSALAGQPALRTLSSRALTNVAASNPGRRPAAIASWTAYLKRHPTPVDLALQAMAEIAKLELASANRAAHRKWLQSLYESGLAAGESRGEAGQQVWADAAYQLGAEARGQFRAIALRGDAENVAKQARLKLGKLQEAERFVRDAYRYGRPESTSADAGWLQATLYSDFAQAWVDQPPRRGFEPPVWREMKAKEAKQPYTDQAVRLHRSNVLRFRGQPLPDGARRSLDALKNLDPELHASILVELDERARPEPKGATAP